MDKKIRLKRPGMGVGDTCEASASFEVPCFELYGRHHEVSGAEARVCATKLAEGLHLEFEVVCEVVTTCDRTLEPVTLALEFGESEFLSGPNEPEPYVEDWELNVSHYTREALPSEIPMQVFCAGTEPVNPTDKKDGIDPRWRSLGDFFAANF
jgi:uncharacterized protein